LELAVRTRDKIASAVKVGEKLNIQPIVELTTVSGGWGAFFELADRLLPAYVWLQ
jgi:hypothetical protein